MAAPSNILVTGTSGYVGSRLTARLLADGHAVRGFSRHPEAAQAVLRSRLPPGHPDVPVQTGDAISGAGLERALEGTEVAYYLMHSLEPSPDGAFGVRELRAAKNFVQAAERAGTERVIYLGGLIPSGGTRSAHLASRLAVERALLESGLCTVAFRASIVIGAGSRSFRLLVRLVERMPILPLPAWRSHRTSPVDERDLIEFLARAARAEGLCGRSLDLAGPEEVTYGELVERIRDLMLVGRPTISFRRLTATPIVSRIAAVIGGEDHDLVGPLMESLQDDLLPVPDGATDALGVRLHSLDAAIEHALREWEAVEPLAAR